MEIALVMGIAAVASAIVATVRVSMRDGYRQRPTCRNASATPINSSVDKATAAKVPTLASGRVNPTNPRPSSIKINPGHNGVMAQTAFLQCEQETQK